MVSLSRLVDRRSRRYPEILLFIAQRQAFGTQASQLEEFLDTSHSTVMWRLAHLERMGFIVKKRATHRKNGVAYFLSPTMAAIQETLHGNPR